MANPIRDLVSLGRRVAAAITGRNYLGSRSLSFPRPNTSGSRVTEQTALTYTAYWRAVSFLSSTLAHLPIDVMRRQGGRRLHLEDDPAEYMLNVQANDELPAFAAREAAQAHVLTWGGGYAEIERTRIGDPVATHILTPERVMPDRTADGRLVYVVSNPRQANSTLDPFDVFHVRGLAYDGVIGYSPVALFRNAIGMGISAEQYGASFFGNGAHPGGVLQTDKNFNEAPEVLERIRGSWSEMHQGPSNAHRVAILEDGLKWANVGMPHTDAQFLENRKFQVSEMARIFNVPPFVVGDLERSTNNNIEAQAIELVVYGLVPWLRRWESEIDVKILRRRETGKFARMNLGALLRGDSAARANFYDRLFRMGVYSPNEIRALEDRDPIGPEGDVRLVPMNMVRLDQAGTETQKARAGGVPGGDGESPNQKALGMVGAMVRESLADVVGQTLARLDRKTARATGRHATRLSGKPAEFRLWLEEFWREHASELRDELEVPVAGLARAAAAGMKFTLGAATSAIGDELTLWIAERQNARILDSVKAHGESPEAVTMLVETWSLAADQVAEALVDRLWNAVGA
jgi:HK97 family phage portal protein